MKENVRLIVCQDKTPEDPRNWSNLGVMIVFSNTHTLGDEHDYISQADFLLALIRDNPKSMQALEKKARDTFKIELTPEDNCYYILKDGYPLEHVEIDESDAPSLAEYAMECCVSDWMHDPEFHNGWGELVDILSESDEVIMLPLRVNNYRYFTEIHVAQDGAEENGWIYVTRKKLKEEGLESRTDDEIRGYLRNEVKIYNRYLQGDVWGFILEKETECPSCKQIERETIDSCWGFYGRDWEKNGMTEQIPEKYLHLLVDASHVLAY